MNLRAVESPDVSYLYFMPVFMLCSLEEGTLWTESCPRLRATIATALNLLRVPVLGLLAFCRFSRSSVLRLTPPRWSVHTSDTCILPKLWANTLDQNSEQTCGSPWFFWDAVRSVGSNHSASRALASVGGITALPLNCLSSFQCWVKTGAAAGRSECAQTPVKHSSGKNKIRSNKVRVQH